ncbi:hypothetical protein H5410_001640, partial [Solanum commersonii]
EIEPDSDFTAEYFCLKSIQSVLYRRVDTRVDEMVNAGLLDEVRLIFIPYADYTKGIRWSIGVPEMASYLREEFFLDGDDESKKKILQASISSIKRNSRVLICNQLDKIKRLINEQMWSVKEIVDEAWSNTVLQPCLDIVKRFLKNDDYNSLNKKKVVFIMGVTRTRKSRLSIDLATHFRGEIINSDKIQVYKGLDIVTNKITHAEKQGIRHYLLGETEPDSYFKAEDFYLKSIVYIEHILKTQCVPIIVGGSNSHIEKLVEDPVFMFKYKYDSCFILIDVKQLVLNRTVDTRVDEMVNVVFLITLLVFKYMAGVPEMASYLREEKNIDGDDESNKMILQPSISIIKHNTRILICN